MYSSEYIDNSFFVSFIVLSHMLSKTDIRLYTYYDITCISMWYANQEERLIMSRFSFVTIDNKTTLPTTERSGGSMNADDLRSVRDKIELKTAQKSVVALRKYIELYTSALDALDKDWNDWKMAFDKSNPEGIDEGIDGLRRLTFLTSETIGGFVRGHIGLISTGHGAYTIPLSNKNLLRIADELRDEAMTKHRLFLESLLDDTGY